MAFARKTKKKKTAFKRKTRKKLRKVWTAAAVAELKGCSTSTVYAAARRDPPELDLEDEDSVQDWKPRGRGRPKGQVSEDPRKKYLQLALSKKEWEQVEDFAIENDVKVSAAGRMMMFDYEDDQARA